MSYIQLNDIVPGPGNDGRVVAAKALQDLIVSGHVASATIQAGGTGYAVDDVIQLDTGTALGGWKAEFLVLTVSAGVITALALRSGGVYSTLPNQSTAGHATTALTGAGTGATLNVIVEGPWEAVPVVGGSGYAVADVIEVDGGSGGTTDPSFVVTAVSGGAVTALAPLALGDRTTHVDTSITPAATTALSGIGDNALTVNYNRLGWILIASDYTDDTTDFEFWVRGKNGGGADPFVGIKTLFSTNSYLQIRVAEAYSGAATFDSQAGTWADGFDTGVSRLVGIGTTETADFSWFVYKSGRVINAVLSDDNSYELLIAGLFIPFTDNPAGTFTQPYIAGGTICSPGNATIATAATQTGDTRFTHSSLLHHADDDVSATNVTPHRITNAIGIWGGFDRGATSAYKIWPYMTMGDIGNETLAPTIDGHSTVPGSPTSSLGLEESSGVDGWFNEESAAAGTPGVAPLGASGQLHFMASPLIISDFAGDGVKIHGQLEGLAYINGRGINDEDRVTDRDGRRWIVLPDTVTNSIALRFALLEG